MVIKKYTSDTLKLMILFRRITRVDAVDCFFINSTVFFIAPVGKIGLAIGKAGKNIKNMKESTKKNIKIIEEAKTPGDLVRNYIFPLKTTNIFSSEDSEGEKILNVQFQIARDRRHLLSNNQAKLKELKELIDRFFPGIKEIRILQ